MAASLGYTHMSPTAGLQAKIWDGFGQNFGIYRRTLDNTVYATNKASIDQAIKYGTACIFFGHNINVTGPNSSTISITDFRSTIDYALRLRDSNVLDIVSLQDLIDGIGAARRRRV